MRGPVLYCVEQADNQDADLRDVILSAAEPSARFDPDLLGGIVVLQARARAAAPDDGWKDRLYRSLHQREEGARTRDAEVTAVPYYAWASREAGAMRVWLRSD